MKVQPYLFFNGRCEEAIEFYKRALGAQVSMLLRFKENPEKSEHTGIPPGSDDKIMHACLQIGDTAIMASDGMATGSPDFKGISLSLDVPSEAETDRLFKALCDGGQTKCAPAKTFFSPRFAVVEDRFGVSWMIVAQPPS